MRKLRFPTTKKEHEMLNARKEDLLSRSSFSKAENHALEIIKSYGLNPSRQAIWGYRLYDFWFHDKGIAIEIDGIEHDKVYDEYRDKYNYLRSGILVYRSTNFDSDRIHGVCKSIINDSSWIDRKKIMVIHGDGKKSRRKLIDDDDLGSREWNKVKFILDNRR